MSSAPFPLSPSLVDTRVSEDSGTGASDYAGPDDNGGGQGLAARALNAYFNLPLRVKLRSLVSFQVFNISLIALTGVYLVESAGLADGTSRLSFYAPMLFVWLFCFATALLGANLARQDVTVVLMKLCDAMRRLGRQEEDVPVPAQHRRDEIGEMARNIELFRRDMRNLAETRAEAARSREAHQAELADLADRFERSIGDIVASVATAASQLQTTAGQVAAATEQSRGQTDLMKQSMDKAARGTTAAAAASDEFAMSINEISRQATSSAELARRASETTDSADEQISALTSSADEIGEVVELIQTIAKRTNLLALNASIEAARGGEAGRGFAVVATEVKELATQTSRATDRVAGQIGAIQHNTTQSVAALRSIKTQVDELETTAVSIASAVDQQSVAGQDLARSIDLAARSTDEVVTNVSEVREATKETGTAADQMLQSASELQEQARTLREQAQRFLVSVRQTSVAGKADA